MQLGDNWRNCTVSHGTLQEHDIVSAIEDLIQTEKLYGHVIDSELQDLISQWYKEPSEEHRSDILNESIFNRLNEIAPDRCYFGAHPGDGSDLGFWEFDDDEGDEEEC